MNQLELELLLTKDIQHNCNISDARDHGIYSMCTMVLKLRNLYKWEHGLSPWDEPESDDLLNWIENKENYWQTIAEEKYGTISVNGNNCSAMDSEGLNRILGNEKLVYGAGYGRSMKAVFFLAEQLEKRSIAGCPVFILGQEKAKEMASPFAMAQEGSIYIRKDSLRYFLWDQIQELRSSCREAYRHTLQLYDLLKDGQLDHDRFRNALDTMVEEQMNIFIHHEIGEIKQSTLDSKTLAVVINRFPGTIIELVSRSIKDILADTHPQGLLAYIVREKKESSLSLYVGLLDGLRKELFPEVFTAWNQFLKDEDWALIEKARLTCRNKNLEFARSIREISSQMENESDERVEILFNQQVLVPLGLNH